MPLTGALLAVVFWGISFVATKAALAELTPIALIFWRFAMGALLLVGVLAVRGRLQVPPRDTWGPLALMGGIGIFIHQMLQVYALSMTSAVHAGWLIGFIPIWSAILAALFLGERFGAMKLAGLIVGFGGVVLVVTRGRLDPGSLALPATRGDLLIFASTLNWAIYSVVGHGTIRRLGADRATAWSMVLGLVMIAPFFLTARSPVTLGALSPSGLGDLSPTGWSALAFLGIACSGLGYLLWYAALEVVETARVASLLYIEPLVTLAAAMILLGEPVGAATIAGGLLVMAGVGLVQGTRRRS